MFLYLGSGVFLENNVFLLKILFSESVKHYNYKDTSLVCNLSMMTNTPCPKMYFCLPVAPYLHDVHLESHPDRLHNDIHRCGWLVNRRTASRCSGHDYYFDLRASSDFGILPTHTGISQKEILQHGPRVRRRSRSDFILQVKE